MEQGKRQSCICLLLLFATVVYGQNLYQTCTNIYASSNSSYYNNFNFDLGNASMPHDQAYTTTLRSGATVHLNVCAGTSLCNGAIACIAQNGIVLPYAIPSYAGSYYAYYSSVDIVQMYFDTGGDQYLTMNITCDRTTSPPYYFRILNATLQGNELYINASSLYACATYETLPPYVPPTYYTSFSAPIFMKGRIPFFLQDVLTSLNTEFVGNFYYSTQYGVVMNGTLTNKNTGASHFVAFYYVKEMSFNPPTLYNYVLHQGANTSGCYNLGNPSSSYAADIFSVNNNFFQTVVREYTPIYFNKGSGASFPVKTYSTSYYNTYETVVSLMQRLDGVPVFIGAPSLSPWAEWDDVGSYVSELNWLSINSTTLGANTFQPPASYGCQLV